MKSSLLFCVVMAVSLCCLSQSWAATLASTATPTATATSIATPTPTGTPCTDECEGTVISCPASTAPAFAAGKTGGTVSNVDPNAVITQETCNKIEATIDGHKIDCGGLAICKACKPNCTCGQIQAFKCTLKRGEKCQEALLKSSGCQKKETPKPTASATPSAPSWPSA
jgi:hypothetical protein